MKQIPIILDTDIGSDIDDAVALAYLLKQPQCELLGITTVSGEPDKRAELADAVCRAGGRTDIPIHVGAERPLVIDIVQAHAPQAEALTDKWPHRAYAKENLTAIEFLRETILARPGEITLLPIGPLTNIALLFSLDPTIASKVKRIMMMGGEFYANTQNGGRGEWNIICDPHAAQIVFQSDVPELIAVGLDVTTQCKLPAQECRERFAAAGGALELVSSMAEVWFRHTPESTFHDPLAAALIFDESLCTLETRHVDVEIYDVPTLGFTIINPDSGAKPHHLAKTVDRAAFFKHYFEVVGK